MNEKIKHKIMGKKKTLFKNDGSYLILGIRKNGTRKKIQQWALSVNNVRATRSLIDSDFNQPITAGSKEDIKNILKSYIEHLLNKGFSSTQNATTYFVANLNDTQIRVCFYNNGTARPEQRRIWVNNKAATVESLRNLLNYNGQITGERKNQLKSMFFNLIDCAEQLGYDIVEIHNNL